MNKIVYINLLIHVSSNAQKIQKKDFQFQTVQNFFKSLNVVYICRGAIVSLVTNWHLEKRSWLLQCSSATNFMNGKRMFVFECLGCEIVIQQLCLYLVRVSLKLPRTQELPPPLKTNWKKGLVIYAKLLQGVLNHLRCSNPEGLPCNQYNLTYPKVTTKKKYHFPLGLFWIYFTIKGGFLFD